jgi:hypothetical protein
MQYAGALQPLSGGAKCLERVLGQVAPADRQRLEVDPQMRTTLEPGTMSSLPVASQRTHALCPPS